MNLLPLALLLTQQRGQGVPLQLNLPITAYDMPVVGGMREFVLGIDDKEYQRLGLFYLKPTASTNVTTGRRVINYEEVNIGHADTLVKRGKIYGHDCFIVEASGATRQPYGPWQLNTVVRRWWYVDSKTGKLWRDYCQISTQSGTWSMDAIMHADSFDVTLGDPKGEKTTKDNKGLDLKKLDAAFTPMIVGGKRAIMNKTFKMFDPLTGIPVDCKVMISGRFSSPNTNHLAAGNVADISGQGSWRKAFISDAGDLFKVELPKARYLQWNPTVLGG